MISSADCTWPALPARFLTALKQAVEFIIKEYPNTVGILAAGTIVRGKPDRASDLDIYVIHVDDYRQRVQAYFNGVPAEIFINAPSVIEKYLQDETEEGTPITAHMIGTGHVIVASDPIVGILVQKARLELSKSPPLPKNLEWRRYELASLFEDAIDLSERDVPASRMILSMAVQGMLRHYFVVEGRVQPRLKDLLNEVDRIAPEVGQLAKKYYRTMAFKRQLRYATRIADRILGTRGFFAWKSERQPNSELFRSFMLSRLTIHGQNFTRKMGLHAQ